ncbi:site-specific DNA-methyltransferase [Acinetobacter baumannii]
MPEFEGKVNCIYIDPPYNTGNEGWVYNDNVNDPRIIKWLGDVVGKEGEDLSRHDKWLCMMYPRLKLLHRLLADDGVIFISIDNNEQAVLKILCDEIFGISNYISMLTCINNPKGRSDDKYFATAHEYILVYKKNSDFEISGFEVEEKVTKRYNKVDELGKYREIDLRKTGDSDRRIDRPDMFYPFYFYQKANLLSLYKRDLDEACITIYPMKSLTEEGRWRWGKNEKTIKENFHKLAAVFMPKKQQWTIIEKDYLENRSQVKPTTVWDFKDVNSERGTELLYTYLGFSKQDFPNPKPLGTIQRCIKLLTNKDAIILDSFAGSGTTAHAVLELNAQDGGNRRFILCEMMDYAESITAERVRRVMEGYGEGNKKVEGLGGSFDFYELGDALFSESGLLNESVGIKRIRQYIAYSESIPLDNQLPIENEISPSALGLNQQTLWLFHYNKDAITSLDLDFLGTLNLQNIPRPSQFVVYADKCVLDDKFMQKHGITFKRIPRDIMRF